MRRTGMSVNPIRVTVWNEYLHERTQAEVAAIYPDGIHEALAAPLRESGFTVRTATQDQPEHGLTEAVLADTDVLLWWGHRRHHQVDDAVVDRVQARVLAGMGLIPLHSSHFSKIFNRLMGTTCNLKHRVAGERERIWTIARGHPIAAGLPEHFDLKPEEMYGEPFDIYLVHLRTRKSPGDMMRKLSVTLSQSVLHLLGTSRRRKPSTASQKLL